MGQETSRKGIIETLAGVSYAHSSVLRQIQKMRRLAPKMNFKHSWVTLAQNFFNAGVHRESSERLFNISFPEEYNVCH